MAWVHRITNVDEGSKTADCANCGRVGVYWTGKRWQCREHKRSNKGKYRKGAHGLTRIQANSMKDGSACEICGSTESLKVDHDHATMEIRGVLCHSCNVGIGHFRDSPNLLAKAMEYLQK